MPKAAIRSQAKSSKRPKKSVPLKKGAAPKTEVAVAPVSENEPVPEVPNKRCAPTRDIILEEFEALIMSVDAEIENLRDSVAKTKGVKFLRSLNKTIKVLRNRTSRVMKQKQKTGRTSNKNSGFLKPVPISKEMAKFTGWNQEDLRSRVEVTKYICDYISQNDLQNPEDRRQINPDGKLSKLLKLDKASLKKDPLRYYSLQTHLKHHFPKKSE